MGIYQPLFQLLKHGAIDYLAKPADAEDVEKALLADPKYKASASRKSNDG